MRNIQVWTEMAMTSAKCSSDTRQASSRATEDTVKLFSHTDWHSDKFNLCFQISKKCSAEYSSVPLPPHHQAGVLFGSTNGFRQCPWSHQVHAVTSARFTIRLYYLYLTGETVCNNLIERHEIKPYHRLIRYFHSCASQPNTTPRTPRNQSAVVFKPWRSCCRGNEARRTPLMWQQSPWHLESLLWPAVHGGPWCLMTWWAAT